MGNSDLNLCPVANSDIIRIGKRGSHVRVPPYRAFALGDDHSEFAEACRRPVGLAEAFGMVEAMSENGKGRSSGCARSLYIIEASGEEQVVKIGVSANALKRRTELQGAHYRKLSLYAVVFFPTRNSMTIEQALLARATENGTRLCGEWIATTASDLLDDVLNYARDHDIPVVDGRTWFDDMIMRTRHLARGTKFRKAA